MKSEFREWFIYRNGKKTWFARLHAVDLERALQYTRALHAVYHEPMEICDPTGFSIATYTHLTTPADGNSAPLVTGITEAK